MTGILNFLYVYIVLIVFWFIINVIFYALTVITKKALFSIPFFINIVLNWILQIYVIGYFLYLLWQIIIGKEWLLLILGLIFGGFLVGWWQMIYGFLMTPFNGIVVFFSEKAAKKIDENGEEFDYEYISPEGKVIGKYHSIDRADKLLWKWFLISYVIGFLHLFISPNPLSGWGPIWFIIFPMLWIIVFTAIISIFVGIWNLIKRRSFLGGDKKDFITKCLKINAIIYVFSLFSNILILLTS